MRIRKLVAAALAVTGTAVLLASPVAAQAPVQIPADNTAYGTTSAEFLLFPVNARGAALGNGYGAIVNDVSAVHFNPSALVLMERPGIQASSMTYVADTRYNWIGLGLPSNGGSRAFGLSIATFGFSDQPVYTVEDPNGDNGEVYSVSQTAIGVTYAQRFSDRFAAGITAKYVNDQLGLTTGRAFAVDFGTTFMAEVSGRRLRAAFSVQNLGTNIQHQGTALDVTVRRDPPQGEQDIPQEPAQAQLKAKSWPLPVTFRVSLAYDAFQTSASRLSIIGEFNQPNNTDPGFNFAGEYDVRVARGLNLAGRMGFTYAPDNNLSPASSGSPTYAGFPTRAEGEGMDGFSAGGGLRWQMNPRLAVSLDYAYRSMGLLGGVNMFSVGLSW